MQPPPYDTIRDFASVPITAIVDDALFAVKTTTPAVLKQYSQSQIQYSYLSNPPGRARKTIPVFHELYVLTIQSQSSPQPQSQHESQQGNHSNLNRLAVPWAA